MFAVFILTLCSNKIFKSDNNVKAITSYNPTFKSGYSVVNGLKMYYKIYDQGKPFVLIHSGGSTIQTTFEILNIKF